MAKSGNRYLRYYVIEAANRMPVHLPKYAAYYGRKYCAVTKQQHQRVLVLTARRSVGLFVGRLHRNEAYRQEDTQRRHGCTPSARRTAMPNCYSRYPRVPMSRSRHGQAFWSASPLRWSAYEVCSKLGLDFYRTPRLTVFMRTHHAGRLHKVGPLCSSPFVINKTPASVKHRGGRIFLPSLYAARPLAVLATRRRAR